MLTTRTIYYPDWNIMMESTRRDCEFLDRLELIYSYVILIGIDKIEVEFKVYN
jgi:hypothetical protein